jgi:hypothetical protein
MVMVDSPLLKPAVISASSLFTFKGCLSEKPIESFPYWESKHRIKSFWNYCGTINLSGPTCINKAKSERAAAMNAGCNKFHAFLKALY